MKVSIFSIAVNNSFPIDVQFRQFQKYVKDRGFEFILFNDAFEEQENRNIECITSCTNIKCVRVPQSIHEVQNPSMGYASTLNWVVKTYAPQNNHEIIVCLHSDVFPYSNLCFSEILEDKMIASTMEYRLINGKDINYLYPALTILNIKALSNKIHKLDFGLELGLDTGGKTHYFIEKYPELIKRISNHPINEGIISSIDNLSLRQYLEEDLKLCAQFSLNPGWIAESSIYHYIAGSRWNAASNPSFVEGHEKRMALLLKYFY